MTTVQGFGEHMTNELTEKTSVLPNENIVTVDTELFRREATSFRPVPVPVARWLQAEVDGKAAPAIYTVHSTAPAYQNNRVIVSARDATTTTYVAHAFFQPVLCDCYAGTCDAFDGS